MLSRRSSRRIPALSLRFPLCSSRFPDHYYSSCNPQSGMARRPPRPKISFAINFWWTNGSCKSWLPVVISFVYKATGTCGRRRTLLAGMICGTVLVATISFLVHYYTQPPPGKLRYMTTMTRDLQLRAAILNLGLGFCLSAHDKKTKLLLITGGLGLQLTVGAIGHALRDMSPQIVTLASDLLVITNIARIYIWWRPFARSRKPPSRALTGRPN